MTFDPQHALTTAETLARRAGALLLTAEFPRRTQYKEATDPVTEQDRQAEALIIAGLHDAFPDQAITGEESGSSAVQIDGYRWHIDPIDGTINFVHGWPRYCVSIGLADPSGAPLVGVIYNPTRDECFTAIRGGGAQRNGQPIHVSGVADVEHALLLSGFNAAKWTSPDNNSEEWTSFVVRTQSVLCTGSTALDLCDVAAGRADGCWQSGIHSWDVMAGLLLVQEAGGRVSNYRGLMEGVYAGERIVASNGLIHERMLTILMMGSMAPRPSLKK